MLSAPRFLLSVAQGQEAPTTSLAGLHWLQVWTGFSAVTGYMLYRCSAKKIIDRHTPRLVGAAVSCLAHRNNNGGCTAMSQGSVQLAAAVAASRWLRQCACLSSCEVAADLCHVLCAAQCWQRFPC